MVKLNECLCDYSNQFSFLPPFPTVFCVTVFFFCHCVFFIYSVSPHTHTTLPSVCLHPPCAIYSFPSIFLIPFNTSSSPPSRFASHPPFIFLFLPFPPSNFFSPYLLFSFFCLICFHELMNPLFFFPLSYLSFTHSLLFLPSPIPPSLFLRQSVSSLLWVHSSIFLQAVILLFYLLAFLVILQRVWAYIGCFICT